MKFLKQKILLALLLPVIGIVWTPQAQAIPAFARQTGLACDSCHWQHFPVLNSFGRMFKEGGFTMVGSEDKITGDFGLSLPVVLNAAIETYTNYTKTNGQTPGTTAISKDTNSGTFDALASSSVFFGGRVNKHVGFESELNIYPIPAGMLNFKLPIVFDAGDAKVGIVPYSTAVYGPSFGLEVMDTGANAVHLFNQFDMPVISAQQYINTSEPAQGADLIASNDNGFIVLGKWMPDQADSSGMPTSNYARIAFFTDVIPNFDVGIGAQYWGGRSADSSGSLPGTVGSGNGIYGSGYQGWNGDPFGITTQADGTFDTKAWAVDAQMLGDVGNMPLTLIASYASAPSSGAPSGVSGGFQGNILNPGTATRSSFNLGVELGVYPRVTLQGGLRFARSGFAIPGTNITNATDNAWLVGATYELSLNTRVDLSYSKYSGDLYDAASQALQLTNNGTYAGDSMFQANLIAAF